MNKCKHFSEAKNVMPLAQGCIDCLKKGNDWVHLRICLSCGYIGCCDDSRNKHATKHFKMTTHPVIKSFEKDESWMWCFVDKQLKE